MTVETPSSAPSSDAPLTTGHLTKARYDALVSEIDRWWSGPTSALAHPILFYELGQLGQVVEAGGQLVGFLLGFITPDGETGYVHLVGIDPHYRRRGVGKLLYDSFERECRAAGCKALKAITTLGNEGSVRFHVALGWIATEVADYAGPERPRVVFRKELSG